MASTITELITRVAQDYLGILAIGQSLDAQDNTRLTEAYNEVYAELKEKKLATWTSTGSIPDDLAPAVRALVAFNCHSPYGLDTDRYNRLVTDFNRAEARIREVVFPEHESQTEARNY